MGNKGLTMSRFETPGIVLGALADSDVISVQRGQTNTEDVKLLHCKYSMTFLPSLTDTFEGPITVGWAPGDLTDAEIEECIEAVPLHDSDYPAIEHSQRPVFPLETFSMLIDTTNGLNVGAVPLVKQGEFKPRWRIQEETGWRWWAYNHSGSALATGGFVEVFAKWFGVWLV